MVPLKVQLDPDDHYVGGNNIEFIVVHGTGNETDSDEGNANYFCTGDRESSAHYFVDDDSITQLVKDCDGAWHCGDGGNRHGINNRNSLGIEMCCTNYGYSEATIANTIELVRLKMKQYNIPIERVVRHYDASGKNCPSGFSANNWAAWYQFKQRLASSETYQVSPGQLFRVRKSWDDIKSQIGAFTDFNNAKDCANSNPGYSIFSSDGKQVYPSNPEPAPSTPDTPDYHTISFDANILRVQQALNRLGFTGKYGQRLLEDGIPGVNTDFAVRSFQMTMGILVDGDPGDQTWTALNEILSKPFDSIPSPHYEFATRYIQWRVGAPINGYFNSTTATLVMQWQKNHGCDPDGKVGINTWARFIG